MLIFRACILPISLKTRLFLYFSFSGCTFGQQQYFVIPPSDISVAVGQTAVISCVVGNRAGRVQWTKGGLTLGKLFGL